LNQQGRLCTDASLQVLGFPGFFASGDCAVIQQQPRPASGVWAVRATPILAANLQRLSLGKKLRRWQPQTHALQLLGDAKGRAYGQWGPLRWDASRLSWLWKQKLDQHFMAMLQQPSSVMADSKEMACSGCAAKLPAQVLNQALNQLGLDQTGPQDAAIVGHNLSGSSSQQWLQSCDGFPALVADPWLNARLTTLHACSDLWASGAQIQSAQLLIQLPRCSVALQSELLSQSLAGVQSVLAQHGARLLGGHSLQAMAQETNKPLSQQLLLALTVNGFAANPWLKGPLQPGDVLLISRSIGSGVLFAAAQLGKAKSSWISEALELMQQSQAALLPLLAAHGCQVCTDVTGFGLLGHLTEMLAASPGVQLQLELDAAPALKGSLTLLQQGIASSLAPSNMSILEKWPQLINFQSEAILQLWLDPQTCGPLLAAIPAAQAKACLTAMQTNGFPHARQIAMVMG
ncbi:MAG: selenide, water dikinase SelD, partial [Synechococcaceae bacterium WBB_32_011]|nr:selenide, water dikinase SelD [Synechococcaceae bacterium WBB_32_011]